MKWLYGILSLYLLLLLVVPCCTFDDCPDDKISKSERAAHSSGDEDDCGTCSPFSNCAGCATVSMHVNTLSFTISDLPEEQVFTGYISSFLPLVSKDCWRPPQLWS